MRHINIPIFIPHLGCPNQCIFCNQRLISGSYDFIESDVDKQILEVIKTISPKDECEIAFFGGSFTGIDRALMIRLLDKAQSYVDSGRVSSIRMSTRPDYIDKEIIKILKKYTISCVELGIQSMNDDILKLLKRGHSVKDTLNATRLLNKAKIKFIGQMMIGLPGASLEDETHCAKEICRMGAVGSRIYPTIVFKNTELEKMTKNNEYIPLNLDDAIDRSATALKIFVENNVKCIRIGLCDSENLHSESSYVAGPNNASIGEMVKSKLFYTFISEKIQKSHIKGKGLIIECAKGLVSQVVGNKKRNIIELKDKFGIDFIKVIENDRLFSYEIEIREMEENSCV
ncbi:MAG: radical SAM protein [Clostridia bacterium]|nr:radical SAM protein [Clostridia bacterium]